MTNIYTKTQFYGGQFQGATGVPISNGYLVWQLSHDSNVATLGGPSGVQVAAGLTVRVPLDVNGNIAGTFSLWTNDLLTPSDSYYTVRCFDSHGIEVWACPQYLTLVYSSTPVNVGTLQPVTP